MECFKKLQVPSSTGEPIYFHLALLEPYLNYCCQQCSWFASEIEQTSQRPLNLILYFDEATAGNVLAVATSKKMGLFYAAIKDLGMMIKPTSWMPIAAMPSRDLKDVDGGLGRVFGTLIQHLASQVAQPLTVFGHRCSFKILHYIGDYESIVDLLSAMGPSSYKPCTYCQNVLGKFSDLPEKDQYFCSIHESDPAKFEMFDSAELHSVFDRLMTEADTDTITKEGRKKLEQSFGFHLSRTGFLANVQARGHLNIDNIMLDSCHCYYANGVACQEMVMYARWMEQTHSISIEAMGKMLSEVPWRCSSPKFSAPGARQFLFHASLWKGDLYKGSATAVFYLLPVLRFYRHVLGAEGDYAEDQSFDFLLQIHSCLKKLRYAGGATARQIDLLENLQPLHQAAFVDCWGREQTRPKHHLRFHLPEHYRRFGYCDCFAMEAKHQIWKGFMANSLQSLWSEHSGDVGKHTLPRLLHRTILQMTENSPAPTFIGRVYTREEVYARIGIKDCEVCSQYRVGSLAMQSDQILFFSAPGRPDAAAVIELFARWQGHVWIVVEDTSEEKSSLRFCRTFKRLGVKLVHQLDRLQNLRLPSWWLFEDNRVVCLE
ncbi:Uncharacterized protein SCF082_LOCUS14484 [Durusdinium trenchii]|uniref:Uncharacterized protein n=1 Tax=Durusdinium trenchii TaxID=1381693 RepID=A0ABP0JYL2_9DINO